jgi:hypothetical protein
MISNKIKLMSYPYNYFHSLDYLNDAEYHNLEGHFLKYLQGKASAHRNQNYDAEIYTFQAEDLEWLSCLVKPDHLKFLADVFGIKINNFIDAAIHINRPNNKTGWVHTDFSPGWFPTQEGIDRLALPDMKKVDYRTGELFDNCKPFKAIRSIASIFFIGNDWNIGDGGEVGVYESQVQNPNFPTIQIPPVSNSLFSFECSPHSFHSFITNKKFRNSIIFWCHSDIEEVKKRWPLSRLSSYD